MTLSEQPISIIIPAYNSAEILPELVSGVDAVLTGMGLSLDEREMIFVNDNSRDSTWDVICSLACKYPWVRGINLMRNYGQHNALLCGIRSARHDVVVTIDDDLQHPPEEIPKLLDKL